MITLVYSILGISIFIYSIIPFDEYIRTKVSDDNKLKIWWKKHVTYIEQNERGDRGTY
jgi:hypothetical protein